MIEKYNIIFDLFGAYSLFNITRKFIVELKYLFSEGEKIDYL
jgi:hypothetical protein